MKSRHLEAAEKGLFAMKNNIGLVSVSFRKHTPEEILHAMGQCGLKFVEWGSDIHAPCTNLDKVKSIAMAQAAAGITCCSYGTYFRLGENKPEELVDYIKAAKILGTNILRLWCGNVGSQSCTEQQREALYADCRKAAEIAGAYGVILCMECHNGTLTDRKESALALMQAVDSPAFRMYWQPNQLRTEQENLAYAKLLNPYIVHVHAFNWTCNERFPLAEAYEQWQNYRKVLPAGATMLLEFMPDDRIESLKAEADALRKIVGE